MRVNPVALFLTLAVSVPSSAAVSFQTSDFAKALESARTEQRPVMIDFYAVWCGPCKLLDQSTWTDAQVTDTSRYFVNLKIDAESKEGSPLAGQYGVEAFPTIVFLDGSGKEAGREVGFQAPPAMLLAMRHALRAGGASSLARMADAASGDAALQLETARAMISQKLWDPGKKYLERAKSLAEGQDVRYRADVASAAAELAEGQSDLAQAEAAYREAARLEPDNVSRLNAFAWFCATHHLALEEALPAAERAADLSARAPGILDTLAELHHALGDEEKALAVIDEAIRGAPDEPYYQQQRDKFLAARQSSGAAQAAQHPASP